MNIWSYPIPAKKKRYDLGLFNSFSDLGQHFDVPKIDVVYKVRVDDIHDDIHSMGWEDIACARERRCPLRFRRTSSLPFSRIPLGSKDARLIKIKRFGFFDPINGKL